MTSRTLNTYKWSARSLENLRGVRPELTAIATRALHLAHATGGNDFLVTEGLRTLDRQRNLLEQGASHTMNSRHLTGHAIDLAVIVNGEVRWDWPLYERLAETLLQAAEDFGIPLEWGGHWDTLKDGPHFQLPWDKFPPESKNTQG